MKDKILAVVGPTASGKTALSVALSEKLSGEVISIDSMQIYKGMSIGTAAPTIEEMRGIPHHLIGFADTTESFSVADYTPMAKTAIYDIIERNKLPVLCGGTGLYLDGIISIGNYSEAVGDNEIRRELEEFAVANGNEALHNLLKEIDPEAAEAIHMNNVRRVIRAIEIYRTTGKTKTQSDKESLIESEFEPIIVYLNFNSRSLLYDRIDKRVDIMFDDGLLDEVQNLYDTGRLREDKPAYQAIGYKEFIPYFEGKITLEEVKEQIKINTRHYSKRQQTWFKRYKDAIIINPDKDDKMKPFDDILNEALSEINNRLF